MALLFRGNIMATIKPWVFQHFLSKGAEMVLYIDSDFMIFDNLENLAGNGDDGVVLVPHVLSPVPRDGMQPDETTLLGSGMFNAGMFGVGIQHGGFLGVPHGTSEEGMHFRREEDAIQRATLA